MVGQHLASRVDAHSGRMQLLDAALVVGAETADAAGVTGIDRRPALDHDAVAAQEIGMRLLLVEIVVARDIRSVRLAVFIENVAADQLRKRCQNSPRLDLVHQVAAHDVAAVRNPSRETGRFRVEHDAR